MESPLVSDTLDLSVMQSPCTLLEFPFPCRVCWLYKYLMFTLNENRANSYLCDDIRAVVVQHEVTVHLVWLHKHNVHWESVFVWGCPGLCMSPCCMCVLMWDIPSCWASFLWPVAEYCGCISAAVCIIYEICMAWASTWDSGGESEVGGGEHHYEVRGGARGRPVTMNYTGGTWHCSAPRGMMGNRLYGNRARSLASS